MEPEYSQDAFYANDDSKKRIIVSDVFYSLILSADIPKLSHRTRLWNSLLNACTGKHAVNVALMKEAANAEVRAPRYAAMEKPFYWLSEDGDPLILKFPALLDLSLDANRVSPYLNLVDDVRYLYIVPLFRLI